MKAETKHRSPAQKPPVEGTFDSKGLKLGIYRLRAAVGKVPQAVQTGEHQVRLSPSPFNW